MTATNLVASSDLVLPQLPIGVGDQFVHLRQQVADVLAARLVSFHPNDLVSTNTPSVVQASAGQLAVLHLPGVVQLLDLLQNPVPNFAPEEVVNDAHAIGVHAGDDVVEHQSVTAAVPPVFGSGMGAPGKSIGYDPGPIFPSHSPGYISDCFPDFTHSFNSSFNPSPIFLDLTFHVCNCNTVAAGPKCNAISSIEPYIKSSFDTSPNLGLYLGPHKSVSRSSVSTAKPPGEQLICMSVVIIIIIDKFVGVSFNFFLIHNLG